MNAPQPQRPWLPRLIAGAFVLGFLLWAAFMAWYVLQERHRQRLREEAAPSPPSAAEVGDSPARTNVTSPPPPAAGSPGQ